MDLASPCELWPNVNRDGYGQRLVTGKFWYAHRYAWTQANGPIPEGVSVLQICGVRNCINVEHLQLGLPERLVRKQTDGCWIWTGATKEGYGRLKRSGRMFYAHRYFWELTRGPIPMDLTVDHLCRVRACVNPDHLELVTLQENIRRGTQNWRKFKTHCVHGHPFDEANTQVRPNGERRCRTCGREETRRYRAAKTV